MVLTKLIQKNPFTFLKAFDSTFIENSVAMCGADLDIGSFGWSDHIWVLIMNLATEKSTVESPKSSIEETK